MEMRIMLVAVVLFCGCSHVQPALDVRQTSSSSEAGARPQPWMVGCFEVNPGAARLAGVPSVIELTTELKQNMAPETPAYLVHSGDQLHEEARQTLERMWGWRPVDDGVWIWLSNGLFGQSLRLSHSNGDLVGFAEPIACVASEARSRVPVTLRRVRCGA